MKVEVPLPSGSVLVSAEWELPSGDSRGVVAIAHGAGAGMEHPFLVGFASGLREHGFSTVRFNFPYREAGRRMPGPAAHAVSTWRAVIETIRAGAPGSRVWACGKSYGGRMASMAASQGEAGGASGAEVGGVFGAEAGGASQTEAGAEAGGASETEVMAVDGLVYLGYPLHPPGRPEKPRVEHLSGVAAPQLFLSGTNDPFVQPLSQLEDAVGSCQDARVVWVEGGGHSFEVKGVKRSAEEVGASVVPTVVEFIAGIAQR